MCLVEVVNAQADFSPADSSWLLAVLMCMWTSYGCSLTNALWESSQRCSDVSWAFNGGWQGGQSSIQAAYANNIAVVQL